MRRTALLLGAMFAALVAVSGVAWALTTIYCAEPGHGSVRKCWGTQGDDLIIGTDKGEQIEDEDGDDVVRAGRGPDLLNLDTNDSFNSNDITYGGPGDDRIQGQLDAERHYGGGGDDRLADYFPSGNPDVFRCGDGYDVVTYNEGEDKVAADCEELSPYQEVE